MGLLKRKIAGNELRCVLGHVTQHCLVWEWSLTQRVVSNLIFIEKKSIVCQPRAPVLRDMWIMRQLLLSAVRDNRSVEMSDVKDYLGDDVG